MNEKYKTIDRIRTLRQMKQKKQTQWQLPERRKNREERLQQLRSNGSQIQTYKHPAKPSTLQKHSVSRIEKTKQKIPKSANNTWPIKWLFWIALLVIVPAGAGITAISALFKLPSQADCEASYWPTASASKRLYCAQILATSPTVDSLLQAINLVDVLSNDHPMRPNIDGYIEQWSEKILSLGDLAFQDGKLEEAIKIAQKVPQKVSAYPVVKKQIENWQKTWTKAETTYQKAQEHLRQEEWNQASMEASRLLSVPNVHWETKKYQELINDIKRTRKEGGKLNQARDIGEQGGLDNLTNAVKKAQAIGKNSYLYQTSQKLILNLGEQIADMALVELNEGNWQEAIKIVNKVPENDVLEEKVKDIEILARAHSPANLGTIVGLEDAIAQAQKLKTERPLYSKAQQLISIWQQEIADVKIIEEGKKLAQPGGISDLKAAIAKLQTVPPYNPGGQEATTLIEAWSRQLQQQEDRPYLEKAEKLASFGDLSSIQAAIDEASQIGRGRTLYEEAQQKIQKWTQRVQRSQDQPILDNAELLASSGNLEQAILIAQQIKQGRVLYPQASSKIQQWQSQKEAEESLENARQAAALGTADGYAQAINLAQKVPTYSSRQFEASQLINQWGQQILSIAMDEVNRNVPLAIEIASKIPVNSVAYNSAQSQIRIWQTWLTPTPSVEDRTPTPEYQTPTPEAVEYQTIPIPPDQSQQLREENQKTITDERGKPLISAPKFINNN
ncbi:MAG: hypothetical protein F6K23_28620 [Okeania sp. SIO2C9]|uniref:hypothetical protein n=1 Tax=Okeania sp. SIO2C9 TaxID=2607791 RepID=UPI0013C01730|nr:hypothetical protein [Okeania sp. SIO2C9]NEQ76650.1 hypothetical protein [Okeania sp. SIO2C9]